MLDFKRQDLPQATYSVPHSIPLHGAGLNKSPAAGRGPPPAGAGAQAAAGGRGLARRGLDEGLLSLNLSNLLYMENPYSYKKWQ